MTNILGPDVSFYQDDPTTSQTIDFAKMKAAGAGYVIIRGGQNAWSDRDFKINWPAAKAAGLPRGSYWFFDSRIDPKFQAELWVSLFYGDFGELPLFADFEERYGGKYGGWSNWNIFLEHLKVLVPGKELGIYTAYYYWKEFAPNYIFSPTALAYCKQYPLWIANYGTNDPLVPRPWSTTDHGGWTFWQFTDHGDGYKYGVESKEIDLNYFNGDQAAFNARFGLESVPEPKPTTIQTHPGILYCKGREYGTDYIVHVIDLSKVEMNIRYGFEAVDVVTRRNNAALGFNNVGWGSHPAGVGVSNDLLYIEGVPVQADPIDYRKDYSINIKQDKSIAFDKALVNPWNVIGFDRIISKGGVFNSTITDTSRAQRTIYAKDNLGRLVIFCCEGRITNQAGLTFRECWKILLKYGVTDAGNADGGNSTCAMNTAISDQTLIESYRLAYRKVVSQTLFYAKTKITGKTIQASLEDGTQIMFEKK